MFRYLPPRAPSNREDLHLLNHQVIGYCQGRRIHQETTQRLHEHVLDEFKELVHIVDAAHGAEADTDNSSWLAAKNVQVVATAHALGEVPSQLPGLQVAERGDATRIADATCSNVNIVHDCKALDVGFSDPATLSVHEVESEGRALSLGIAVLGCWVFVEVTDSSTIRVAE
jgi:hypothetical protein